jgi:hypothetical protein
MDTQKQLNVPLQRWAGREDPLPPGFEENKLPPPFLAGLALACTNETCRSGGGKLAEYAFTGEIP